MSFQRLALHYGRATATVFAALLIIWESRTGRNHELKKLDSGLRHVGSDGDRCGSKIDRCGSKIDRCESRSNTSSPSLLKPLFSP
ncbi:hypothetical protein P167DRAFT_577061 [Morchella conica CCBAS932]|uniref:Uncharacterized protein n=1 Tax=Morchella conica CCBAS932 TaxID=1392247 RepID=A0A3N4KGI0_9PEZI|nr:hypothetical protein P167DRAFT_577061 [Morchella conica CCBAS932]